MQTLVDGEPFELISGALSLDLLDTVADRSTTPRETLTDARDVRRWCDAANFGEVDEPDVKSARELRDAIEDLVAHLPAAPSARTVSTIDAFAAQPDVAPQIRTSTTSVDFEAVLSTIARDAITLTSTQHSERVRQCDGCAMWFIDRSRPGTRRWCSSTTKCGNRARLQRHRSPDTTET